MKMKTVATILILAVAALAVVWYARADRSIEVGNGPGVGTTTPTNNEESSVSTGLLAWSYPENFGLAVTEEQLRGMVRSYIPPCDESFDYCLYYNGEDFAGTNFESAGVRVLRRVDLTTESACLNAQPTGYQGMGNSTSSSTVYSASIFSPLSEAATGHYSNGELYRVHLRQAKACYELETQIGETQLANMPTSTRKFSESDRDKVYQGFRSILDSLKIATTSEAVKLPDPEN